VNTKGPLVRSYQGYKPGSGIYALISVEERNP
jgi:hypothetical protein